MDVPQADDPIQYAHINMDLRALVSKDELLEYAKGRDGLWRAIPLDGFEGVVMAFGTRAYNEAATLLAVKELTEARRAAEHKGD